MKRFLVLSAVFLAVGCSTDDRFGDKDNHHEAGNSAVDAATPPNVCELAECPRPEVGLACCTPLAQCGTDPSGLGLTCVPNAGSASSEMVCALSDCPEPTVGIPCCTPFAQCGFDPTSSGLPGWCFANPPDVTAAGIDAAVCDVSKCPAADGGASACCLPNGDCGVDSWGIGICFAPPPDLGDAAVPPISTTPPDDPSVTGECPSYLSAVGPVWGCCSDFGVCGTFANDSCLLPVGTVIPVSDEGTEDDAGDKIFPYCNAPKKKK